MNKRTNPHKVIKSKNAAEALAGIADLFDETEERNRLEFVSKPDLETRLAAIQPIIVEAAVKKFKEEVFYWSKLIGALGAILGIVCVFIKRYLFE